VKRYFKDRVYGVVIPRNVLIAEAPSHGQPVLTYDKSSRGSAALPTAGGRGHREKRLKKGG
jgi:chromosome partitioning protein